MDGYGKVEEYAERAKKINQQYLCVSDHGVMGAIPRQIKACDDYGLNPIYGSELYINPIQPEVNNLQEMQQCMKGMSEKDREISKDSAHLLALAYNETGYSNLVKLCSFGWVKGFYKKPRINYDQLRKYNEGIIFTSCCYNSEVGRAFDKHGPEAAMEVIDRYVEMVGKDNYYLEFMLLDFSKQKPYNKFIVDAHLSTGLPIIISNDVHYCNKEDSHYQSLMLMIQTNRTIQEIEAIKAEDEMADLFELQDTNLWMKSEEELNAKWLSDYQGIIPYEIFLEAKRNTVRVAERCRGVQIDRSIKLPQLDDADDKLKDAVLQGFKKRGLPNSSKYKDRLREEFKLIKKKGFSSYFLIQQMICDEARRVAPSILGWGDGSEAVGPGRGCLSYDVPIVMSDGKTKFISQVSVGDEVVTLDGSIKPVIKTHEYDVSEDEDLLEIKTYLGDSSGVRLTKDHLVYVEKHRRHPNYENWSESTRNTKKTYLEPTGDLSWERADSLSVGDWLFIPNINLAVSNLLEIDLAKYCNDNEMWHDEEFVYQAIQNPLTGRDKKVKRLSRFLVLDEDWMQLIGRFAADGWIRKGEETRVGFCFNKNDEFGKGNLIRKANELGIEYTETDSTDSDLTQIYLLNKYIFCLFREFFDEYNFVAQTKHVPNFVFKQDRFRINAFLRGYFLGDGHSGAYKGKWSTVSSKLADQIRFLNWIQGNPVSKIYSERYEIRGGEWGEGIRVEYSLNFPHSEEVSGRKSKPCFYRKIKDGILVKIKSIEPSSGHRKVYDLSVQDNHNYLTSSFLVHNSAAGSLICYCLGITDVDPIYEDLLFSRFLSEARGGKSIVLENKEVDPWPPGYRAD